MKIVHVVESLGRGGLERMVIDLAENQVNAGHACLIICLFTAGELFDEAVSKNIECIVCDKKKGIDISALFKLFKTIYIFKPDIIHTHNAVANYYIYYSTYFNNKICLINTRHGMGAKNPNSKRERFFNKSLAKTNFVVAVCIAAKLKLINDAIVLKEKCVVICNGIKVKDFEKIKNNNYDNTEIKINNDNNRKIIIGSIGRLNWAKDYSTLLEVFKVLVDKYSSIELKIAGGGALMDELVEHANKIGISSYVTFLGDTEDIKPVLSEIDIFVSTSVSEGYSIALLEASAAGVPIVATDVGGNAEIIRNRENGFIVAPKDVDGIAERISELIENHELRNKFIKNGLEWVELYGDVENMSKKYNELYLKSLHAN